MSVSTKPGRDDVGRDAPAAELAGHRPGQADQAGLAGARSWPARRAVQPDDAGDEHDPARGAAGSSPCWPAARSGTRRRGWCRGRPSKSSSLIRSSSPSRVMPALATSTSTGPCAASTVAERGVDRRGVRDVAAHAEEPVRRLPGAVGDGDAVAVRRQGLGDRQADPPVAPGDEHAASRRAPPALRASAAVVTTARCRYRATTLPGDATASAGLGDSRSTPMRAIQVTALRRARGARARRPRADPAARDGSGPRSTSTPPASTTPTPTQTEDSYLARQRLPLVPGAEVVGAPSRTTAGGSSRCSRRRRVRRAGARRGVRRLPAARRGRRRRRARPRAAGHDGVAPAADLRPAWPGRERRRARRGRRRRHHRRPAGPAVGRRAGHRDGVHRRRSASWRSSWAPTSPSTVSAPDADEVRDLLRRGQRGPRRRRRAGDDRRARLRRLARGARAVRPAGRLRAGVADARRAGRRRRADGDAHGRSPGFWLVHALQPARRDSARRWTSCSSLARAGRLGPVVGGTLPARRTARRAHEALARPEHDRQARAPGGRTRSLISAGVQP